MSTSSDQLDPRAWLLWAAAAGLPPLLGRNPLVLLAVLFAGIAVWLAVAPSRAGAWRWLVRLAGIFALIGALFNLLTAHLGDRVIARWPAAIPIIGGVLTLNALVYGLLSGLAVLSLVVIGVTLAATLDHAELLRMLPGRLTTVAVAGSVALAFLPQTVTAFHEIREAQMARGYRLRGARGLLPLLVPLLTGGLERALTLAEALESRGFGGAGIRDPEWSDASPPSLRACRELVLSQPKEILARSARPRSSGRTGAAGRNISGRHCARLKVFRTGILPFGQTDGWRPIVTALGLTACAAGGYLLAVGKPAAGIAAVAGGLAVVGLAGREPRGDHLRRTRYRRARWSRRDGIVATAALITLAVEVLALVREPGAFQYQPYPAFTAPHVNLWLLAALALLLAPAIALPAAGPSATTGCEAPG